MSDPLNPQTNDDTFLMDGTVTSIAVEAIGTPSVIFWCEDSDGVSHQMNGSLESEAVSRLGMLRRTGKGSPLRTSSGTTSDCCTPTLRSLPKTRPTPITATTPISPTRTT